MRMAIATAEPWAPSSISCSTVVSRSVAGADTRASAWGDGDRLGGGVEVLSRFALFTLAHAGGLLTTEGQVVVDPGGGRVHLDHARVQAVAGGQGRGEIAGVHGGHQPVRHVVGGPYRLVQVRGGLQQADRAEDLLAGQAMIARHTLDDGGLDEPAVVPTGGAPGEDGATDPAGVLGGVDDAGAGRLGDDRADGSARLGRVAVDRKSTRLNSSHVATS